MKEGGVCTQESSEESLRFVALERPAGREAHNGAAAEVLDWISAAEEEEEDEEEGDEEDEDGE